MYIGEAENRQIKVENKSVKNELRELQKIVQNLSQKMEKFLHFLTLFTGYYSLLGMNCII